MHELLRCRVSYFSDGLAIGSKEFVEQIFKRCPAHFGVVEQFSLPHQRGVTLPDHHTIPGF